MKVRIQKSSGVVADWAPRTQRTHKTHTPLEERGGKGLKEGPGRYPGERQREGAGTPDPAGRHRALGGGGEKTETMGPINRVEGSDGRLNNFRPTKPYKIAKRKKSFERYRMRIVAL